MGVETRRFAVRRVSTLDLRYSALAGPTAGRAPRTSLVEAEGSSVS